MEIVILNGLLCRCRLRLVLEAVAMKDFLRIIFGKFSLKPAITPEVYALVAFIMAMLLGVFTEFVYWVMRFFH